MGMNLNIDTLKHVLNKSLNRKIINTDYQIKELHGGTLGDVKLISGNAESIDNEKILYKIVKKIQKKWKRHGDPNSWRREYDLYTSDLGGYFSDTFSWPEIYYTKMNENEDEIQIWMEYIDGVSGLNLTGGMYEFAAEELGSFQGKLYAKKPDFLKNFSNLSSVEYMENFYLHYRSWKVVYDYIRSDDCKIPRHLCKMLIDTDENFDEILNRIKNLPIVLCHRDFWVTNIFYQNGRLFLIDWDTAGWGYFGEDLASLIADEADIMNMVEHYHKCIPAYYKGFSEYVDVSHIKDNCVYELILLMFGYRIVEWYINGKTDSEKTMHIDTLQKVYEMKDRKIG
jgi:hypothetical protein